MPTFQFKNKTAFNHHNGSLQQIALSPPLPDESSARGLRTVVMEALNRPGVNVQFTWTLNEGSCQFPH